MNLGTRRVWGPVAAAIAAALVCVTAFQAQPYRLLYNVTESMPLGWYLLRLEQPSVDTIPVGATVAYHPLIPAWAAGRYHYRPEHTFIKTIGAVPGEVLHTEARRVFACPSVPATLDPRKPGCRALGEVREQDSLGKPIPFEHRWHAHIIPPGFYYLYAGRRPESFDSRYQGLIPAERILGGARYLQKE